MMVMGIRPLSLREVETDKLITPSIVPTGEWHRTPENVACVEYLLNEVFEPTNILVAHHLCFLMADGKSFEIASVETFLFDRYTLLSLYGDMANEVAKTLAVTCPMERLKVACDIHKSMKAKQLQEAEQASQHEVEHA